MRPAHVAIAATSLLVVLAAACAGRTPARPGADGRSRAPRDVTGKTWRWQGTTTPVEELTCTAPERYTITLAPENLLTVLADCNRGRGAYEIGEGTLRLGPIATTRMACGPGSQDARFLRDLAQATGFFVEGGRLFLDLPVDSGTLRFVGAP